MVWGNQLSLYWSWVPRHLSGRFMSNLMSTYVVQWNIGSDKDIGLWKIFAMILGLNILILKSHKRSRLIGKMTKRFKIAICGLTALSKGEIIHGLNWTNQLNHYHCGSYQQLTASILSTINMSLNIANKSLQGQCISQ